MRLQRLTAAAILAAVLLLPVCRGAAQEADNQNSPLNIITYERYSGLSELITMLCDDTIERFQGFYGETVVRVEPFVSIGRSQQKKISELGMTIADQMVAMVNNDTIMHTRPLTPSSQRFEQKLSGVLQEVDGYLRVHIYGRNVRGERISYVANVEMSEPIYRALHTYL